MSAAIYRRCGCRAVDGKQYAALPDAATAAQRSRACPIMLKDPKHGTWGFYLAAGTDPKTGKRLQYRKAGFSTKQAAQRARNDVAVKVDKGTYVAPTRETFATYLDRWLTRRQSHGEGLKATTVWVYRRYIDQDIAPSFLGRLALSDIRRHHINTFTDDLLNAGRGATTVRRIAAVVQGALRAAEQEDLIDQNPSTGIRLPKVTKHEFEAWEPAQVGRFLDIAARHRLGAVFELAMFTGLRRGEIVGLRWSDVDLPARSLTVRNNRVQAGDRIVENAPKTKAGRRVLELDDRTVGALIAWQLAQRAEADAWGDLYVASGYVFTYEDGRPLIPQYVSRLFDKLRDDAKLPKITFHGQRHENASLLISSGADIAVVAKRLGHSSIAITSDTYGHLIASASRQASENAAALVPALTVDARTSHTQAESEGEPEHAESPRTL